MAQLSNMNVYSFLFTKMCEAKIHGQFISFWLLVGTHQDVNNAKGILDLK